MSTCRHDCNREAWASAQRPPSTPGTTPDEGQQSLRFTDTALAAAIRAATDEGVDVDVEILGPVRDAVLRQISAGYGAHGTARLFEELRNAR